MLDFRQSEKYGRFMEKIGWQVEKLDDCQIFIKKLPFLPFSIVKIQRPEKIDFDKLDKLAKQNHALFIKLEPRQFNNLTVEQFNNRGYKFDKSPLLPTKTLQISLIPSIEQIFNQFTKDGRYEIRRAEKNGLQIVNECAGNPDVTSGRPQHAIDDFISLWHQNALHRGFWLPLKKQIKSLHEAFGKDAYLVLSHLGNLSNLGKPKAGALIIISGKTAYYSYAASSPPGRQLAAPSLVVWKAIKLAKEKGCTLFDFEGIYDERFPNQSWLGFTHFKKSFGGQEIEYPGCFTKYFISSLGSKLFNPRS